MGMVVRTNTMAINAYRQLGMNNNAVAKSLEKLASGYRINRAGDDAAGLAISEKMKAQITGLETASSNAQDGISLIQTAEGNLSEVHDMLNRMVELATKSANGTYTKQERQALQDEVDQLLEEIDRISQSANFNGAKLLNGDLAEVNAINADNIKGTPKTNDTTLTGTAVGTITFAADHTNPEGLKSPKNPAFAINLADVKFTLQNTATDATATFTVGLGQIGGTNVTFYVSGTTDFSDTNNLFATDFTVTKAADASTPATTDATGTQIATLYKNSIAVIDGAAYNVGATGSKLTFTYAGKIADDELKDKATDEGKPTDGMVAPYGDVSVTLGGDQANRFDCHIVDITDPQGGSEAVRSGASLTLSKDIIDRGELKIGDTTFSFSKTTAANANGSPTGAGTTSVTIGLKDFVDADGNLPASGDKFNAMLQSITEQMSHCTVKINTKADGTGTDYTFNVGRGSDLKTIEIEESFKDGASSLNPADYGKFTQAQLEAAFSQTQAGTAAKTEVTLSEKDDVAVNFTAGNTLKVGETTFKFVDGTADTTKNEISVGATAAETLDSIAAAVNGIKNGATPLYNAVRSGNKLTITDNTGSATAAPKVEYTANTVDAGGLTLQIGDTAEAFNKMTVFVKDMSANGLGLEELKKNGIMTEASASSAIDTIKDAINTVSNTRAGLGALQNRLEHTINNLDVAAENLSSANSRIRDTDMAKEMMNYTKMNVLVQSAQAMLAQANQQPQSVLQLLQ